MNTQAIAPIPCTPNGLAYFGGFDRRAQTAVPAVAEPVAAALTITEEDARQLTAQYHRAIAGLFEAWKFGRMLMAVRDALEAAALTEVTGSVTRDTARDGANGGALLAGGWNAGTGLKGWLSKHCPEVNYASARRFLSIADKTSSALGDAAGDEDAVRAYLEGKSQRQILRTGGAREGAGRPRKNWTEALGTSPEVAMKRLEEALAPLNELIVVRQTHRLLSALDLETVRDAVDLLHERVHAEI